MGLRPDLRSHFGAPRVSMRRLLARIEGLTDDEMDRLAKSAATTTLLEDSVESTGSTRDPKWRSARVAVAVAFGARCAQLEPAYDPRDEWSMSQRSVLAQRACQMVALSIIAREHLTDDLAGSLTAAWDDLPTA